MICEMPRLRFDRSSFLPPWVLIVSLAGLTMGLPGASAETPTYAAASDVIDDSQIDPLAKPTAIVLNYCRASFHRIQKTPSKRVLLEEQEKILNNLNLNPIADGEIIRLYTAVLTEIADVQIADQERAVIQSRHHRAVVHDAAISALAIGGQVASMQYVSALKTGAKSWWDYRTMVFDRDLSLWRVDKDRIVAFVDKSSLFLDTFWKLARKRGIPDQWLVRGNDLDQLAAAINEPRPEVRLRVLRRMERFMECYPPYWYYVARTQQALGQFTEALETYSKLESLGDQYFRKDEMLAAAFANQALIEDYIGQQSAVLTARKALDYSTEVWQVNLMCGVLLLKHGFIPEAEDAILRNLDVNLESSQSLVALLAVYQVSQDTRKLVDRLSKPEIARRIPAPLLLECVGVLGTQKVPQATQSQLIGTLQADFDRHFGPDDFRLEATSGWQFDRAEICLSLSGKKMTHPAVSVDGDRQKVRFARIAELGSPLQPVNLPNSIELTIKYPETETITLHLQEVPSRTLKTLLGNADSGLQWPVLAARDYRMVAVDLRGKRVVLTTPTSPLPSVPTPERIIDPMVQPVNNPITAPSPFTVDENDLPVVPAF